MMRAFLTALYAGVLILPAVAADAQQVLVKPAAPDWFESNRTLQVLQAQERPHPAPGAPGGLGGAEATQVYQNFIKGIGTPLQPLSGNSYGPPTDFGSGSSSGGQQ